MRHVLPAIALAVVLGSPPIRAQSSLNASEPAVIAQTVDGTRITIEGSRPRTRGRTGLFGTQVPWGEIWTPGANQATTLAVSNDVTIDGHPVPKGKYSVWIVMAPGAWEMVLDRDTTLFHTNGPKARPGQIRFTVQKEHRPFLDILTWSFPTVTSTGMTLAMQWDTVYVPLAIKVPPSYTTAVSPEIARLLTGTYRWHFAPDKPGPVDTTVTQEPAAADVDFAVRYENGELRALTTPAIYGDPTYANYILIPRKGGWYYLGRVAFGELIEIWDFAQLKFTPASGQATGFDYRLSNDEVMATGKRVH